MNSILAISDAASLALHTAAVLAADPDRRRSAREIVGVLGVSHAHLAKVLQRLARAGLVRSVRGPAGGFSLGRDPAAVTLLDVYEAVMGPLRPSRCLLGRPVCAAGGCVLGGLLRRVDHDVRGYFERTPVSALAALRLGGRPRSVRQPSGRKRAPESTMRRGRGRRRR